MGVKPEDVLPHLDRKWRHTVHIGIRIPHERGDYLAIMKELGQALDKLEADGRAESCL
jgi:hypothetical protein